MQPATVTDSHRQCTATAKPSSIQPATVTDSHRQYTVTAKAASSGSCQWKSLLSRSWKSDFSWSSTWSWSVYQSRSPAVDARACCWGSAWNYLEATKTASVEVSVKPILEVIFLLKQCSKLKCMLVAVLKSLLSRLGSQICPEAVFELKCMLKYVAISGLKVFPPYYYYSISLIIIIVFWTI